MKPSRDRPPLAFCAYLVGIVLLVLWGLLPSEVSTRYDWQGALIVLVLIAGTYAQSQLCRWMLVLIGVFSGFGVLLIQTPPLEFAATMWSILAIVVTSFLITPAMRRYTSP